MIAILNPVFVYLAICVTIMTYQYAMATFPAVPITDLIRKLDALVGFDWLDFAKRADAIPYFDGVAGFIYRNWKREFMLIFALLAYFQQIDEAYEFSVIYIVAGTITLSLSGFLHSESVDAVASYAMPCLHRPTSRR